MTTLVSPKQPVSIEVERSVLGSLLIDPDAIRKAESVRATMFYRETHGWVFTAMRELNDNGQPIDFTLLTNRLEEKGQLADVGGPAYLTDLVADTPTALYVEHYIEIMTKLYEQRQLIAAAGKLAQLAYDQDFDPVSAREQALSLVTGAFTKRADTGWVSLRDAVRTALDQLDGDTRRPPLATPWGKLNLLLGGGFFRGQSIVIAGRPGMGKTSMMLQCAIKNADQGYRTAFFSLEMPPKELATRALSMLTGINSLRLRNGNISDDGTEADALMDTANKLAQMPLTFNSTGNADSIFAAIRQQHADHGLDAVYVDYLQLLGGDKRDNRNLEIGEYTRRAKNMALELDIAWVWGSQLSRNNEKRQDKRPELADLRDSGSIEQDQDIVIGLYRDEYYSGKDDGKAEAIILKHRQGPIGTVPLAFDKKTTSFANSRI